MKVDSDAQPMAIERSQPATNSASTSRPAAKIGRPSRSQRFSSRLNRSETSGRPLLCRSDRGHQHDTRQNEKNGHRQRPIGEEAQRRRHR